MPMLFELHRIVAAGVLLGCLCLALTGCSDRKSAAKSDGSTAIEKSEQSATSGGGDAEVPTPAVRKPAFGTADDMTASDGNSKRVRAKTPKTPAAIRAKLKPFQVIVGQWNGLAHGSAATEEPLWRWDFSNPKQPALAFESKDSGFLKSGRLTYLPEREKFRLIADLKDGGLKTYEANPTEPIDVPGDGKVLDRTFTLTFTQVDPQPKAREPYFQIEIQQLQNNRYLTVIHRKTGNSLQQTARIANQRTGTSFAAKLDDYGDKTCVISQGLGTMTVSHKGKTYYVCCSGCKKAFEAEPEKWIASFEKWKLEKGKK